MDIKKSEYGMVKENLNKHPIFEKILTPAWIKENILNVEQRETKHVLFWELLQSKNVKILSDILQIFENELYFNRIISKLKKTTDRDNFQSLITELKVMYYYKKRENDMIKVITYEPNALEKNTHNDILLEIDGEKYYVEILTLGKNKTERININWEREITTNLNKISNHPFLITYTYSKIFLDDDIRDFIRFAEEKIELAKNDELDYYEFDFVKNDMIKAVLTLYNKNLDRGYVGAWHRNIPKSLEEEYYNHKRIKSKILGKIDNGQFNENTKNICAVNLMDFFAFKDDFETAIYGRPGLKFEGIKDDTKNRGRVVSCFIGFERGNYDDRIKIFNQDANNIIEEKYRDLI